MAASAISVGFGSFFYVSLVGVRAGLVEIPLAVFGAWAVLQLVEPMMPYAMEFAAGAMPIYDQPRNPAGNPPSGA